MERSSNLHHQQQQKLTVTRLERRALRSLRLVEKVESIGLENIIKTPPSAMSQLANGIVNRSASPMAQLTSLKNIQHNQQFRNIKNTTNLPMVDNLYFDRKQIRQTIEKGVSALESENKTSTMLNMKNDEIIPPGIGLKKTSIAAKIDANSNSSSGSDEDVNLLDSKRKNNNTENHFMAQRVLTENSRINQMKRQRSRRHLKNGQRQDLGTIEGRIRTDLGRVAPTSTIMKKTTDSQHHHQQQQMMAINTDELQQLSTGQIGQDNQFGQQSQQIDQQPTLTQSFVGTVSTLLFGRKGGWL